MTCALPDVMTDSTDKKLGSGTDAPLRAFRALPVHVLPGLMVLIGPDSEPYLSIP